MNKPGKIEIDGLFNFHGILILIIHNILGIHGTVEPCSCESEGTDCFFLKSEFFSGVR